MTPRCDGHALRAKRNAYVIGFSKGRSWNVLIKKFSVPYASLMYVTTFVIMHHCVFIFFLFRLNLTVSDLSGPMDVRFYFRGNPMGSVFSLSVDCSHECRFLLS